MENNKVQGNNICLLFYIKFISKWWYQSSNQYNLNGTNFRIYKIFLIYIQ